MRSARDDGVDDAVLLGLLGRHVVVAIHVLLDLVDRLRVWLLMISSSQPLEADDLACLNLDVRRLAVEAGRPWWIRIFEFGSANRFPSSRPRG